MTLEVEVSARNMELSERVHDYVVKKVSKLDRYLTGIEEVRVDLAQIKTARSAADRQVAQITVRGRGFILRSEERSDNIYSAIDTALDKIQRRINRFKGKRTRGRHDVPEYEEELVLTEPETEVEETSEPVIARRKRFALIPMDEFEAVEQMALLGHENFFVFYNANTNAINVLYRRRDGSYGLIEPEVG
jgi:putative sigma-54 modulation protein